ncbi:hypothetical protein [Cellulomonas aerilata]|nr:hypothetical protein [Cellulomonas aerilata]
MLAVQAVTHGWADHKNLLETAPIFGGLLGAWISVWSMGIMVKETELTLTGFWHVWKGNPWAVQGAINRGALDLQVRQKTGPSADDVQIEVAAIQGSLIEELRGNVRAAGAIRRLRNVQAATPHEFTPALRRRVRYEVALWIGGAASAQWLLADYLWSRG